MSHHISGVTGSHPFLCRSTLRKSKKHLVFSCLTRNRSCGAPYRMNTSPPASPIAKDPPQVANERPGAVRPLNSDDPNNAAFLLVSISACNCVLKKQKKYGNYLLTTHARHSLFCWFSRSSIHPSLPRHHRKATQYGRSLFRGVLFDQGGCSCCGGWGSVIVLMRYLLLLYHHDIYLLPRFLSTTTMDDDQRDENDGQQCGVHDIEVGKGIDLLWLHRTININWWDDDDTTTIQGRSDEEEDIDNNNDDDSPTTIRW